MLTMIDFAKLADLNNFPSEYLCDWDTALSDILVKEYLKSLDEKTRSNVLANAREDMANDMVNDYCPFTQMGSVFDTYEMHYGDIDKLRSMYIEKIYDQLEDELCKIVEDFFKLGDEPDYPNYSAGV